MKLSKIDWYSAYKKWTLNSGIFEYLFKASPFVTARYMDDFDFEPRMEFKLKDNIKEVVAASISSDRIFIFDLDTVWGIDTAVAVNNELSISPILSYNFLFHPYGIVGGKELIRDLYSASEAIKPINTTTYCFVLDYNRYKEDTDLQNPMLFNNQYEITEEEMPDIDTLKASGIKAVTYFYEFSIKEDISSYLEYLKENNIIIDIVKLK